MEAITSPTSRIKSSMLGAKETIEVGHNAKLVPIPPLDYFVDSFDEFVTKNKLTDLDEAQEMWEERNYEDADMEYKDSAISYLI